ncbi:hypothetical protein [Nevskia sp.]|uniref:hypothetical protein n=1 Tax=Nevskia sp. TaxID=1929292 RepID=UPI0025F3B818|nr:hypothetical protein [Nevskia sp.]
MQTRNLLILLFTLLLSGCGGGSGTPDRRSNLADVEAARSAAVYRYMQGLGSLMLANLTEVDIGERRAGAVTCTGGGTATYADTTPTAGADPSASIQFSNCAEAIGRVNGTMQVRQFLIRLNGDGTGTFNISWSADVVIDGYSMRYENSAGLTTLSPGGAVQVESFGGNDVALVLTAPNGQSVQFSDARINVAFDPATGNANFGGSNVRSRALSDGNLGVMLLPSDLRAAVAAAVAVRSIGAPVSGSFRYARSFGPTATDVIGTGVTNAGLLTLTIDPIGGQINFPGSAGQYAWSSLLAAPDLSLPNTAP